MPKELKNKIENFFDKTEDKVEELTKTEGFKRFEAFAERAGDKLEIIGDKLENSAERFEDFIEEKVEKIENKFDKE